MTALKNVKGLDKLQAMLDKLPDQIEANIMRGAMREGANVLRDGAREELQNNGSVVTGELARGVRVSTRRRRGVVSSHIRTTGKHAYLANWIEHGTAAHRILPKKAHSLYFSGIMVSGINHPGARPKAFMRPAMEKRADAAVLAVGLAVRARLTNAGVSGASAVVVEAE